MIDLSGDIDSAMYARARRDALVDERVPSTQEFLLNPARFGGGGGPSNPFWPQTQLQMHFDSGLTDEKGAFFLSTGPSTSTTEKKFGPSSLYFAPTGTQAIYTGYDTAKYDWWTTDFTLELWVKPDNYIPAFIGNMNISSPTNYWSFGINASGYPRFYYWNGLVTNDVVGSIAVPLSVWTHIVVTHHSGTIRVGSAGTFDGTASVNGTPVTSISENLMIGQSASGAYTGYMDELRIVKGSGAVVYPPGSTYTVPTAAFLDS